MIVDQLPQAACAVQEKGDPSICTVGLVLDLALESIIHR